MLFSRVCELRATNWGQNEMLQTPTYTQPIPYGSQGCSIYIPVSKIQVVFCCQQLQYSTFYYAPSLTKHFSNLESV